MGLVEWLSAYPLIWVGVAASLAAGAATGVGSLPIFLKRDIPGRWLDISLGGAAGVMLAATSFSLVIPAIEAAGGSAAGAAVALVGMLLGGLVLDQVDRRLPHTNLSSGAGDSATLRQTWLFVLAITIHNFPEGLAVGVGFGSGDAAAGLSLAIAIGLQNMPEGLAVALPLLREGYSRSRACLIALATGLVEPLGALVGLGLLQIGQVMLPLALAFAAGAMLFVIAYEVIPETQNGSRSVWPAHSVLVGFVIMMFLDNALG